jgi:hypothetical protein
MAKVQVVYETLKDLVNKDQQGFVTPSSFNNFANQAQLEIFNTLFEELKTPARLKRAGFDAGRDKAKRKQLEEDLARFAKSATLTKDAAGVFVKPLDLSRIITAATFGTVIMDQSTRTPIEMCYDEEKIDRLLISNISAPSAAFPIALVSENLEVFPSSIQKITLRYYKLPEGLTTGVTPVRTASPPTFGYNQTSGSDVYSAALSVDFELPSHYTNVLVLKIAELVGVSLRDRNIVAFAQGEQLEIQASKTIPG